MNQHSEYSATLSKEDFVKNITTSVSKPMYPLAKVSEESWSYNSQNSVSIYINRIILFKNTKSIRIPLHTFEKQKSTRRKITRRGNDS